MRKHRSHFLFPVALLLCGYAIFSSRLVQGQDIRPAKVTIHFEKKLGTIHPLIFGHFTEETLTSWEGGISSELLVDRKFSMPEERNPQQPWVNGTGGGWEPIDLSGSVTLVQDEQVFYSAPLSERITNAGGTIPAGVQQPGYRMVMPHASRNQRISEPFHFRAGERYRVRLAVKNRDLRGSVFVAIGESYQQPVAKHSIPLKGGEDWKVYEFEFSATADAKNAKFMIYTGSPGTIWVDSASLVRADLDDGGLRKDMLEATRKLQPSNVRWPGGWFVSDYHWQDGIGPVDKRPARLNRAWNVYYNNDVGVDDYIAYCRKVGAEPYIVVNVGTGTPEEAAALVEYVNGAATTRWGRVRAQNGQPKPYNVKLWNIGNEEYLPTLGGTSGKQYAANYLAFARAMRAVDPSIKLVAVGSFELPFNPLPPQHPLHNVLRYFVNWGTEFLPAAGKEADYYAIHYYEPGDTMKSDYTPEEFQSAAMVISEDLDRKLKPVFQLMDRNGRRIPIALDEWRMTVADNAPPGTALVLPPQVTTPAQMAQLGPAVSLLNAVSEATVFNMMQRRPADFALASRTILYAYLIGMLGSNRDQVVFSPAARMMELYATRDRCQSLATEVDSATFDVPPKAGFAGAKGAAYVDVSARQHPDGKVVVFLINRSLHQPLAVEVGASGAALPASAEATTLSSDKVTDWNTFQEPDRVGLRASQVASSDGKFRLTIPPHSVTRLRW